MTTNIVSFKESPREAIQRTLTFSDRGDKFEDSPIRNEIIRVDIMLDITT